MAAAVPAAGAARTVRPVAGATADAAVQQMQASTKFLNEKFKQSFGGYDLEKVFWQAAFGVGIAFVAKLVYGAWVWIESCNIDPVGHVAVFYASLPFVSDVFNAAFNWAVEWAAGEEVEDVDLIAEMAKVKRKQTLDELGIPLVVDQVFNEYFKWILVALVGWPILMEARRVRKFKRDMKGVA